MTVGLCLLSLLASCTDSKEKAQRELMEAGVIASVLDVGSPVGAAALLQAIGQKNDAIARQLLEAGVSPNASVMGVTALFTALHHDETDLALHLLELGAEVNTVDTEGATPLMEAAFRGQKDMVAALLAHQADVRAKDADEWTPLMCACSKSGRMAELATDVWTYFGFDPDSAPHYTGHYAKQAAPKTEPKVRRDIVRMLLEAGAENTEGRYGETPLAIAACEGRAQMVKQLVALPAPETRLGLIPPVLAAAWAGEEKALRALKEAKADANAAFMNFTPLRIAADKGQAAIIPQLVAAGANVRGVEKPEKALGVAIERKDMACVKALVEAGADMNPPSEYGSTPLSSAVAHFEPSLFAYLLEKGANPADARALDTAINWGHTACFERLLKPAAGAFAAERGETVVQKLVRAFNHGADEVVLTAAKKAGVSLTMHHPDTECLLGMLDKALAAGIDVNAKDKHGDTALHTVLSSYYRSQVDAPTRLAVLTRLLEAGANPNEPDRRKEYPLESLVSDMDTADAEPLVDEAELLLKHGADPNLAGGKDKPLNVLVGQLLIKPEPRFRMTRLLVAAGADVRSKDHIYHQTPLHTVFRRFAERSAELRGLTQILTEAGAPLTEPDEYGKTPLDELERNISRMSKADADAVIGILKKGKR